MANGTDAAQAIADDVAELHALYGLDTNADGILDTWVDPGAAGYDIATVMATPATQKQIVAIHLALVLRSTNYEKDIVSHSIPALFTNLSPAPNTALARDAVALSATTSTTATAS
jgi:type IV pilus assembly protein PilW